jgi:hypothetical protein
VDVRAQGLAKNVSIAIGQKENSENFEVLVPEDLILAEHRVVGPIILELEEEIRIS